MRDSLPSHPTTGGLPHPPLKQTAAPKPVWWRRLIARFFPSLQKQPPAPAKRPHEPLGRRSARQDSVRGSSPNRKRSSRPASNAPHLSPPDADGQHPDFPLISTSETLSSEVAAFAPHTRIALDTEADSLHCYFDKLCLIQISFPGKNLLIDPLAGVSLEPLFGALEGKTVVIHSADYDLRLLRRCGYTGPSVLFDTMIAARLCGATEFGLAALLYQHFGVTLAKASQKANWALRPLPREMLEYAVNDTVNLLALAEIQEARLRSLGRWAWFEQMCERQIRTASISREKDPETLWRISGYAELSPRGTAILRALWHWRDHEAQTADRPAFHILNNDLLLQFSARFDRGEPVDPKYLRGNRRVRFFEAAESALGLPPEAWPKMLRKPRLRTTPEQENRFRDLRKHRDAVAENLQLDPTLIAPKAVLEQLSRNEAQAREALLPWQLECLPPL
jgi:ribonuclease D